MYKFIISSEYGYSQEVENFARQINKENKRCFFDQLLRQINERFIGMSVYKAVLYQFYIYDVIKNDYMILIKRIDKATKTITEIIPGFWISDDIDENDE